MSANEVTWETDHGDEVEVWRAGRVHGLDKTTDVFRWRVRASNGEIVGSGEGHPRIEDAIAAAERHHPRVLHVKDPALPDDGMCEICDECDGGKGHASDALPSPHDCGHDR